MDTDEYGQLCYLLKECKGKEDYDDIVLCLKKILDDKISINIKITDGFGQLFCCILTEIINEDDMDDMCSIEVVCDALISQVSISNVRWYLLDKCQLLQCLTRKYLNISEFESQIKICKTIQTYLIYSHIDESNCLISMDLVCELMKSLVNKIRHNQHDSSNETFLGLLASLCQIWSNCTKLTNLLDDYQTLRKVLLKFLSAEMVKRTTIVYTMTIMFHLCNSDDRLFNKRNIKQTLQVLFNIMLNKDNSWASLYAASLLIEISRSPRTTDLFVEYKSLPNSMNEILLQLNRKESILIESFLEFILAVISLSPEYRRMIMEKLLNIKTSKLQPNNNDFYSGDRASGSDEIIPITCDQMPSQDFMSEVILYVGHSEMNIYVSATKLVDIVYMELYSLDSHYPIPKLTLLCETIHYVLQSTQSNPTQIYNNSLQKNQLIIQNDLNSIEQYLHNQTILTNLTRIKLIIQMATNLLATGEDWINVVGTLVNETDRIIIDQLDCNLLCLDNYDNIKTILLHNSTRYSEALLKVMSLSVEVFIDTLYFYYRSTELWPNLNLFGDKLKVHLEHQNCPIVLAFALSAASNNQSTLQRALILQGVCLHLQEFNIELMGEKMYQYANEFSKLKSTIQTKQPQLTNRIKSLHPSAKMSQQQTLIKQQQFQIQPKPLVNIQKPTQTINSTNIRPLPVKGAVMPHEKQGTSPTNQSVNTDSTKSSINFGSSSDICTVRHVLPDKTNQNLPNHFSTNEIGDGDNAALSSQNSLDMIEEDLPQVQHINNNHHLVDESIVDGVEYETIKSINETYALPNSNPLKLTNLFDAQKSTTIKSVTDIMYQATVISDPPSNNSIDKTNTPNRADEPVMAESNIECLLDKKVEEIVQKWINNPEKPFTSSEICSLYERRIKSLQTQESLMEEIISNKSAALHQCEAMISQFHKKLTVVENDNHHLRNIQSDLELKIQDLSAETNENSQKINQLESINQTLMETNRLNEVQKKEAQGMNKKIQKKLLEASELNEQYQRTIDELNEKLSEANRMVTHKDNQLESYSHVTKLINKLAFNKPDSPPTSSVASVPINNEPPPVNVNSGNVYTTKFQPTNTLSPPPLINTRASKTNTPQNSPVHDDTLKNQSHKHCTPRNNTECNLKKSTSTNLLAPTTTTTTVSYNNHHTHKSPTKQTANYPHIRYNSIANSHFNHPNSPFSTASSSSISAHDFLQLYKNNCPYFQSKIDL